MATKRITDLTNVTSVQDTDLLIVETSEGTKSVNRNNLVSGAMAHPYNLLDNSDFKNLVNQRGQTSYTSSGYAIDRWQIFEYPNSGITPELSLASGYVRLGNKTYIQQRFKKGFLDSTKYYTVYIEYVDGEISVAKADVFFSNEKFDYINIMPNTSRDIKYVALYDGVYNLNTIPPYIPKGYAVELAECQRYLLYNVGERANGWLNSEKKIAVVEIPTPITMRTTPSVTAITLGRIIVSGVANPIPIESIKVNRFTPTSIHLELHIAENNVPTEAVAYHNVFWDVGSCWLTANF